MPPPKLNRNASMQNANISSLGGFHSMNDNGEHYKRKESLERING